MEENISKVSMGRSAAARTSPLPDPLTDPLNAPLFDANASQPASTLFIINLCSSIAPVQTVGKTIPGFENHKLYQVARAEDGRTRHRLRLGFFVSAADADQALTAVRDNYPTAFVACLSDDDRRFARGFVPEDTGTTAAWKRPVLVPPPAAPAEAPPAVVAAAPQAVPPAKPAATVAKPETVIASKAAAPAATKVVAPPVAAKPPASVVTEIELSWVPPKLDTPTPPAQTLAPSHKTAPLIKATAPTPNRATVEPKKATAETTIQLTLEKDVAPPKPAASTPMPAQPFHVGKGVDIPTSSLSLEATVAHPLPVAPVKSATPSATATKPKEAPKAAAKPTAKALLPTPAPHIETKTKVRAPELDSTQTIRALTSAELSNDAQEKWFAIQLVVSERPVNLDAMPHLDIFEAYRVYSIANAGSGKIVYSLRLGFFREEVSAEAVMGYLRTFFAAPTVMRISTAEQARFKDAPAPKAVAAKGEGKVIELSHARKPTIPIVTMEVTDRSPSGAFKPNSTGSFKVDASGTHKTLKPAAKSAVPATRRSPPMSKTSTTGKYKALGKRSLNEQLLDEARNVHLSESAIRKLPKNDSLLSRLVGKLTK